MSSKIPMKGLFKLHMLNLCNPTCNNLTKAYIE